jgi:hypothetical protein
MQAPIVPDQVFDVRRAERWTVAVSIAVTLGILVAFAAGQWWTRFSWNLLLVPLPTLAVMAPAAWRSARLSRVLRAEVARGLEWGSVRLAVGDQTSAIGLPMRTVFAVEAGAVWLNGRPYAPGDVTVEARPSLWNIGCVLGVAGARVRLGPLPGYDLSAAAGWPLAVAFADVVTALVAEAAPGGRLGLPPPAAGAQPGHPTAPAAD